MKNLSVLFFSGVFGVAVSFGMFVYTFVQEKNHKEEASLTMPVPAFQAP